MDQIAQQLRAEIDSLEQHIERTGNRLLAAQWTDELIGPFERIEAQLDVDDLRTVVAAFHHARNRFRVNGHLADRIDEILDRHRDLLTDLETGETGGGYDSVVLPPDADPGDTTVADDAGSLFFDEDEEFVDLGASMDDDDASVTIDFGRDDEEPAASIDFGRDDALDEPAVAIDFGRDGPQDDEPTVAIDFGRDDDDVPAADALFAEADIPAPEAAATDLEAPRVDVASDELFAAAGAPPEPKARGAAPRTGRRPDDRTRAGSLERPDDDDAPTATAIFAHTLSVDDVAAGLDLRIPEADRTLLEQKLKARLSDRVVAALRAQPASERQYILIPRIGRSLHATGGTLPMTVKNMAKRYIGLFGDIRDLMRYRNDSMMSVEVPEPGWALITAEAPRESLGKNYMEQNQYLRYLSTSMSIPSHLVRRRTMVEAIYDLIVGQLVLGKHLQRASLDWTSSSPAKNDFVCVYYPDEGIRVRDLSRVTHHRSLGVTPNW